MKKLLQSFLPKIKSERIFTKEYKEFRLKVLQRDNFECCICKSKNKLHIHHLYNWKDYPSLRYELGNCRTLCSRHHKLFHKIYTCFNNTPKQFEEFVNIIVHKIHIQSTKKIKTGLRLIRRK